MDVMVDDRSAAHEQVLALGARRLTPDGARATSTPTPRVTRSASSTSRRGRRPSTGRPGSRYVEVVTARHRRPGTGHPRGSPPVPGDAHRRTSTPRRSGWRAAGSPTPTTSSSTSGHRRLRLQPRRAGRRRGTIGGGAADRRRPLRRRADRVGVVGRGAGGRAVRPGQPGRERRDRGARVQLEPLPLAAAGRQGLRRPAGAVPQRRDRARRRRAAGRRRHRAGRVQRRADRDRAPLRHRRDQRASRARSGRSSSSTARSSSGRCRWPSDLAARRRAGGTATTSSCCTPAAASATATSSPAVQERFAPINAGWKAGRGPVRELLRPADGPLAHRVALRQLDQLAGRDRQRGRARRLRRLRRRRHLRPQPGAGRARCGPRSPTSAGTAGRPARGEPQHDRAVPLGDRRSGADCSARCADRGVVGGGPRRQPAPVRPLLQPRGRHRASARALPSAG